MKLTGIKFAFLLAGKECTEKEFQEQHFKQLGPAIAGQCTKDIKYQIFDAVCEHGTDFANDPKINKTKIDDGLKVAFCALDYRGAYYLMLDDVGDVGVHMYVYFIWVLSNSNSIFAVYDVA